MRKIVVKNIVNDNSKFFLGKGVKLKSYDKVRSLPYVNELNKDRANILPKPSWLKVKLGNYSAVKKVKSLLREQKLSSVCEEASCPNIGECFSKGTATFMIMGDICTRRCPFCDVATGRPKPLNKDEPRLLAEAIGRLNLKYVVITSVDRDDLRDGGAAHFVECIKELRLNAPNLKIEILTPDFRGRLEKALDLLVDNPPDVFNHNIENVPRMYPLIRPNASYKNSLNLLRLFKYRTNKKILTKSGMMVGLGESDSEVLATMQDLRDNEVDMLTIGQYLQPSLAHLPVDRYVHPDVFKYYREEGEKMGFINVASGPLVRSSYHADLQASGISL